MSSIAHTRRASFSRIDGLTSDILEFDLLTWRFSPIISGGEIPSGCKYMGSKYEYVKLDGTKHTRRDPCIVRDCWTKK